MDRIIAKISKQIEIASQENVNAKDLETKLQYQLKLEVSRSSQITSN